MNRRAHWLLIQRDPASESAGITQPGPELSLLGNIEPLLLLFFLYTEVGLSLKRHYCVRIWLSLTPSPYQREHEDAGGSSTVQYLTEGDLPSYEYGASRYYFFIFSLCCHAIYLKGKNNCIFSSSPSDRLFFSGIWLFFLEKFQWGWMQV